MCGRGRRRLAAGLFLAGLAVWSSCFYSPEPPSGQLGCGANSSCPKGYSCAATKCWKDGQPPAGTGMDRYIGRWNFTSGNLTVTCSDLTRQTKPLAGEYMIVEDGEEGDLTASFYCDWEVNVPTGSPTTVVLPGQSCMTTSDNTTFTWQATSFNFTTSDGRTGTLTSNISATYKETAGAAIDEGTCALVINGGLTKNQ